MGDLHVTRRAPRFRRPVAFAACLTAGLCARASAQEGQSGGVLLDFTAAWCGPCQEMSPIVSRLERQGYPIRKVDIDQDRALATKYGISSIPCFVLVVNGREVNRIVGRTSEAQLKRMLLQIPELAQGDNRSREPRGEPARSELRTEPSRPEPRRTLPVSNPAEPHAPAPTREEFAQPEKKKGLLPSWLGGRREPKGKADPFADDPLILGNNDPANGANGAEEAAQSAGNDPLAASTRIRVRDSTGINFGAGSIIDSKPGRTLILTCSHLFKEMQADSTVEVDVFETSGAKKYVAQVVSVDAEGDVGLIAIPTDAPLPTVTISEDPATVGQLLESIGCGGGEPPSKQPARVTAINKFLGPDNIECSGLPVPGRSGGGLFNADGELVGVCFAADQKDRRGLYAGLQPIRKLIATAMRPSTGDPKRATAGRDVAADPSAGPQGTSRDELLATGGSAPTEPAAPTRGRALDVSAGVGGASSRAAVPAIPPTGEEAEVVCIIRPLKDPRAASRVVIINRASPRFMSYLNRELGSQPQPTSGRVALPAKPDASYENELAAPRIQPYRRSPESRP